MCISICLITKKGKNTDCIFHPVCYKSCDDDRLAVVAIVKYTKTYWQCEMYDWFCIFDRFPDEIKSSLSHKYITQVNLLADS